MSAAQIADLVESLAEAGATASEIATAVREWVSNAEASRVYGTLKAAATREALLSLQVGRCWYCGCTLDGSQTPHLDHQTPQSRRGSHSADNLVLACLSCNLSKRHKTVDEYRAFVISRDGYAPDFRFYGEQGQ